MAKRFTDTEIWTEDWFLDLDPREMLFWFYIKDKCDHAGILRPNLTLFERITGHRINGGQFVEKINNGKKRIEVLGSGRWHINQFLRFQYGPSLNPNNRVHQSILEELRKNGIDSESGLSSLGVNLGSNGGQQGVNLTPKDKDISSLHKGIGDRGKGNPSPQNLLDLWEKTAKPLGLPIPKGMTPKRLGKARARLKEHPERPFWDDVMARVQKSKFLQGDNQRGWKADFDFIIENPENCLKIVEGKYDGKS